MPRERTDVVYVVDRYPELTQTFVIDELYELESRGIATRVFALKDPLTPYPTAVPPATVLAAWDGTYEAVRSAALRLALRSPLQVVRARSIDRAFGGRHDLLHPTLQILQHLRGARPRRVHAHFANHPAGVGMRVARVLGVPFSVQVHGNDAYARRDSLDQVLRAARPAIAPCDYFADHLRAVEPSADLVTIPVAVDPGAFIRSVPWRRRNPPLLITVARLVEKKGIQHLLDAVAMLSRDGLRTEVVIIGDGPLRDELDQRARGLGIAGLVSFAGAQPRDVVKSHLENATALVLPCVVASNGDRDSQPVVLKEAMAMEVPVVTTREVGIPELVDDASGILVAPGDARALAAGIRELLASDDDDIATMRRHARARLEAQFSYAVTIPRLLAALGLAGG